MTSYRDPRSRIPLTFALLLIGLFLAAFQTGCSIDPRKRVWIDGTLYRFEGNSIETAEPLSESNRWDIHAGVSLRRHVYYYHGEPALLHVWWDLYQGTERKPTACATLRLVDYKHPKEPVTSSGFIVGSARSIGSPKGTIWNVICQAGPESVSGFSLPIEEGVLLAMPGPSSCGVTELNKTLSLCSWVLYYPDHEPSKGPAGSRSYDLSLVPEKGKVLAILKARFVPLPPEELAAHTERPGGSSTHYRLYVSTEIEPQPTETQPAAGK